jgi:hypothetical protein
VQQGVQSVVNGLYEVLQRGEKELRHDDQGTHKMKSWKCNLCYRPATEQHCPVYTICTKSSPIQDLCTYHVRISRYFAVLSPSGLWPSVEPFRTLPGAEIVDKLKLISSARTIEGVLEDHPCLKGERCELLLVLKRTTEHAERILDNIEGITSEELPNVAWLKH